MSQTDPNGLNAHVPGAKLDAGKIRAGLMFDGFARALAGVAAVTTYGASKYTPNGWLAVPDGEARYRDAMVRHLLSAVCEDVDPESGISHWGHICWNALAINELRKRA